MHIRLPHISAYSKSNLPACTAFKFIANIAWESNMLQDMLCHMKYFVFTRSNEGIALANGLSDQA